MRTTLNLPDALAQAAKQRAAADGITLTSFIEEALRDRLDKEGLHAARVPLPTFTPKTPGALIDLDDKDALWDILDRSA
ncbi:CopG family transcriptional regulator [Microbacterium panaciterrae]